MPKLPDIWIKAQADDDTEYSKRVACSVLNDGTFSVLLALCELGLKLDTILQSEEKTAKAIESGFTKKLLN